MDFLSQTLEFAMQHLPSHVVSIRLCHALIIIIFFPRVSLELKKSGSSFSQAVLCNFSLQSGKTFEKETSSETEIHLIGCRQSDDWGDTHFLHDVLSMVYHQSRFVEFLFVVIVSLRWNRSQNHRRWLDRHIIILHAFSLLLSLLGQGNGWGRGRRALKLHLA